MTFVGDFVASFIGCVCAQRRVDEVHDTARLGGYEPNTFHDTSVHGALVRTKYFFNARYLWHKDEVCAPDAHVAQGQSRAADASCTRGRLP